MAIIRWNPWNISSLLDEDWELPTMPGLSRLGQGLNIYETEEAIIAQAALPGVTEEKIDVTVEDDVVRVTGAAENTQEEKGGRRYFMNSMVSSFNYSFRLPHGAVEEGEPSAELDNGILTLTFQKIKKEAPKKVRVTKKGKSAV